MRVSPLALAACLALAWTPLAAQNVPTIRDTAAYTRAPTALRAQPDSSARIVVHLPVAWPVHVSACPSDWCAVTVGKDSGYLRKDSLTLVVPPSQMASSRRHHIAIGVDLSSRLTIAGIPAPHLRAQAEVSYTSGNSKTYGSDPQLGAFTVTGRATQLWVGVGLFYMDSLAVRPVGAPCLIYLGPRAGFAASHSETSVDNATIGSDATSDRTDLWVGVSVGSELFLNSRFSVGAELQVTQLFKGSTGVKGLSAKSPGVTEDWADLTTGGTLVLRFYP